MRRLLLILCLPCIGQFAVHAWHVTVQAIGEASVQAWRTAHDRELQRVLGGE